MEKELEEIIISERKALELDMEDKDLAKEIDTRILESKKLKKEIDKRGKEREKYWKGDQLDLKRIHPKRAKIVDNRIFMGVETMIPILTGGIPEPEIEGKIDNELREKLTNTLKIAYEIKFGMKSKLRKFLRHWFIYYIGVFKYRWDEGFITEVVHPFKIGFDNLADSLDNCDFMYELLEDTLANLIKKFPEAEKKIIKQFGKDRLGTKVRYVEFWGGGGEWVAWKLKDIILDKKKNPNFDYTGTKGEKISKTGEAIEETSNNNLFKKPRFPYIIGNFFKLGGQIYDDTSLIEQGMPLQDATNKRKNQLSDLAEMNKRVWLASSQSITRQDFQLFLNKTGDYGLWLDQGDITQIKDISGTPDSSMWQDLSHSIVEIDNIMGVHSTTRGERGQQETLGGRQLLMGADYGRLGAIAEDTIEEVIEEWYNVFFHMLKVYGTEDFEYNTKDTQISLLREDVPNNILVMVKKGTTVPLDRGSRMEMAIQLSAADKIPPETLFEEMGYSKPEERAEELKEWWREQGKLQPVAPAGMAGGAGGEGTEQLARLKEIMQLPDFQALPDEEKMNYINQAREIVNRLKGGTK